MKKFTKMIVLLLVIICLAEGFFLYRAYAVPSENLKSARKITKIKNVIDTYYKDEIDKDQLEEYTYKGIVAGLGDVYSDYYTAEEFKEMMEDTDGEFSGVGIVFTQDTSGNIKVVSVVEDAPADGKGIKKNDILTEVDGVSVEDKELSKVVQKIRGEIGTKVKLTFQVDGKEKSYTLTRKNIEAQTVSAKMLENSVGYIKISEFDKITVSQFEKGIKSLKKQGMKSLVIDLRDNPGGLLQSVVEIADDLLDEGMIVYTKDKVGSKKEYTSEDGKVTDVPMCVLINENSASASEILAGALKDRDVATLVGEKSFGKGIVQGFFKAGDGDYLKLTYASYYTPDGKDIHKKGINPDIKQKDNEKTKADETLQKAIETLE